MPIDVALEAARKATEVTAFGPVNGDCTVCVLLVGSPVVSVPPPSVEMKLVMEAFRVAKNVFSPIRNSDLPALR